MDHFERASMFIAVIKQGSLVGAAREKGVSPSVISKRLAELETMLGVQLIRRTTRSMTLTEAGDNFYRQMLHLDNQWQSLIDETASLGQEAKGTLRLAAPQPVLSRVLLALIREFQQTFPNIELVLQATDYHQLPHQDADISLCRKLEDLDSANIVGVPICSYENRLFASSDYQQSKANLDLLNTGDLAQHACLPYGLNQDHVWSFSNGSEVNVSSKLMTNNTEVIIQAAIAGQGIAYIPPMIIANELANKTLVSVLPALKSREFHLFAYYQKLDYIPLKVRVFLDFMRSYFEQGSHR